MEQFNILDPVRAGELKIIKNGWFRPFYTLTDDINIYGKLSYSGTWRKSGTIESFGENWIIKPQKFFKRDIIITDPSTAQTITVIKTSPWRGMVTLELPDGRILQFKRDGLFSKIQYWYNEQYGNILSVESKIWSTNQPFRIIPEINAPKNNINLILLAFTGVHLILIRRAHAASAH